MPVARFQMPDGRVARFEVPEGTTPEQAQAQIEAHLKTIPPAAAPSKLPAAAPSQPSAGAPDEAEMLAGAPLTRFALGAASPVLGAAQIAAEAVGAKGVTEHLKRLDEMKRRGMSPAADIARLQSARDTLSRLPGYEAAIARIDQQMAELGRNITDEPVDVAGLAGAVLSPASLAAMKIPAAAGVLGRAGQGAAIGAGMGAVSPVTSGTASDDFWTAKAAQVGTGAALGGVIPPAIEGTRKVLQIGRNILDPLLPGGTERSASRLLTEAAKSKRAEIEAALAANRRLVPGSQPTAVEAAAPAGSPEFSALQTIAKAHRPTPFEDIRQAQESARVAAIQRIGKTETDLEKAIAARAAGPGKRYQDIGGQIVEADKMLESVAATPAFQAAAARAREVSRNAAAIAQFEGRQPVPFDVTDQAGNTLGYSAQGLQYIKSVLDDMAESPTLRSQLGISGTEAGRIGGVRDILVKWMNKNVPGWERARLDYAAASKPINQMQAGQALEDALVKPIGEGERVAVFAGAVRDLEKTVQKATGKQLKVEQILEPEQLASVKGILADLARKEEANRLAALGRSKAQEIVQPFGLPATGPLAQSYMIFKTILGRVSKGVTEKTLDHISQALELPSTTLHLLQRAPSHAQQKLIDDIIARKLGRGAIVAGSTLSSEGAQR